MAPDADVPPQDDFGIAWQIAGTAGEGLETGGETFARALVALGQRPTTQRDFPSRIRGGDTTFTVRLTPEGHLAPPSAIDVALVFNASVLARVDANMAAGGLLLVDAGVAPGFVSTGRGRVEEFPFTQVAKTAGSDRGKNMVALGASAALMGIELSALETSLADQFARKGDAVIAQNRAALRAGHEAMTQRLGSRATLRRLPPPVTGPALFLSGNEAACLGALAAGCRVAAAYPITPASDILEYLTPRLQVLGGVAIQMEDEIAALNVVIGAGFAGARALTATSGPGLSLMTETMGLAGGTETPCVIINCQRPGPSTGMSTKHGQEDLWHMVHGGSGEYVRIVIAPTDVGDAFATTSEAFRLADLFRAPVFVALDHQASLFKQTVAPFDVEKEARRHQRRAPLSVAPSANAWDGTYKAYADAGSTPMRAAIPGEPGGRFISNSSEHGPSGFPDEDASRRPSYVQRRLERLAAIPAACERPVVVEGDADATLALVSWGSTVEACREAAVRLAHRGVKARVVAVRLLWPFPKAAFAEAVGDLPLYVVETNALGQLARLVKSELPVHDRTTSILKYDGTPMSSDHILRGLGRFAP